MKYAMNIELSNEKAGLQEFVDLLNNENGTLYHLVDEGLMEWADAREAISYNDRCMDNAQARIEEIDAELAEEAELGEVQFSREIEWQIACRRWDSNVKAKHHLAEIAPIQNMSTTPIRKNRNGAYIRKGNRICYQYEQISARKHRREEGKRQVREYIPESYEDSTPSYREALERELAALRCEAMLLTDEQKSLEEDQHPDWYLIGAVFDDLMRVYDRINQINAVLENEDGVWHF